MKKEFSWNLRKPGNEKVPEYNLNTGFFIDLERKTLSGD
jgi:hypothetical protein